MNVVAASKAKVLRCAIYTRKSSEEGLEQSFNSLHAQREACEAYVKSQAHEGWTCLSEVYDDGGFSGGSMDRPGLKALLADITGGRIDVVVVYKVDRLTRSLTDFAKIVDTFDGKGVSFVSVTQAFNTTTSMGRLTLNVLLSFAQFEREVTGERIRDKIAQSKARGMWMGGMMPLGYDRSGRTLVINEPEAATVRKIYRRYLTLGSVRDLQEELERQGVRSKAWLSRDGVEKGGAVMTRGALFHILKSRLYLGEIPHHDRTYPGLHLAIIEPKLFDAVQEKLADSRSERRHSMTRAATALLTGRIFDTDGAAMSPSFSYGRGGRLYRYYIAVAIQRGQRPNTDSEAIQRVGADALERFVVEQITRLADRGRLDDAQVLALLSRLELRALTTHLVLNADALFGDDHPDLALEDLQARLLAGERAVRDQDPGLIRIVLPARMQLRGGRTFLELDGAGQAPRPRISAGLIQALKAAHAELITLDASPLTSAAELRRARAPGGAHRRQLSKLAFLAPDLQRAILEGRQPKALTLRVMLRADLPLSWDDQRAWFAEMDPAPRPRRAARSRPPLLQSQRGRANGAHDGEEEPGWE